MECHRISAEYLSHTFQNCSPKLILGLTATYERLDGREKLILDKYCPVCDTITIKEAIDNGWMAPAIIYRVLLDVDLTEYNKANQTFMQHFSFFDFDFNKAMYACTNAIYQTKLAKQIGCDVKEVRAHAYAWNKALRFRKNFIANHPKKIEIAKHILEKRQDRKAITFNTTIEQCESYDSGYVVHSKQSKKKNQAILEEFSKCGPGSVVHSAKSLLEGIDVPGLNLAIITGFNSSKTNRIQSIGRVVRFEPNKEAEIFILILKGTAEEKWEHKAGESLSYIEINEQELENVLDHKSLINKKERTQETVSEFRY